MNDKKWRKVVRNHTHTQNDFLQFAAIVYSEERVNQRKFYNCQMLQILKQEYKTRCLSKTGMKGLLSLPDWWPIIQVYFIHSPAKSSCFLLLRFFLLQKFKRFSGGRFLKHRLNPPFIRSVYLSNLQIGKNLHVLKGRTSKE